MADWDKIGSMGDIDDRRGAAPLLFGGGGLGLAGIVIVLLVNLLGGGNIDVGSTLEQLQQSQAQQQTSESGEFAGLDSYEKFAGAVLGSTNDTWTGIFNQSGEEYPKPRLVLFRSYTNSGCGGASAAVGPHYCPADQTIYIDETFFDALRTRLGASASATGDVAQAYVIAHEVGHHVQNLLGTTTGISSNDESVRLELQADCYAGIWANSISGLGVFEPGEIQEAMDAAAAVGDDRIQETVQGRVTPENWTHGSSADRVKWFNAGYTSGKPSSCNTFRS
jgi:predicted metalloprotease